MSNKPHKPFKSKTNNEDRPNMMKFLFEQTRGLQYSLLDLSIKYDQLLRYFVDKGILNEDEFKEILSKVVEEYKQEFDKQKEELKEKVTKTTQDTLTVETDISNENLPINE